MHYFVTEMCTCVHISVTKWCIVGYFSDVLWNLWNGSIGRFHLTDKNLIKTWNPEECFHVKHGKGLKWWGFCIQYHVKPDSSISLMTPWHRTAFRITGLLSGKSTGYQWIPLMKGTWCEFSLLWLCWTTSRVTGDMWRHCNGHPLVPATLKVSPLPSS